MKEIDKSQIEKYLITNGTLDGRHREKQFIRCTGEIFGELFYDLRNNPNSSYITYINDLIREGYNPQYISVLKKLANNSDGEVLSKRILNYFELPVVYDELVKMDDKVYVFSVDFISFGEEFISLIDCLGDNNSSISDCDEICLLKNILHMDYLCQEHIEIIDRALKRVKKTLGDCKNFDEQRQAFIEDYIYSYLVRKYLLTDNDYCFYNVGTIINREMKTFKMAPNFDLESTLTFMIDEKFLKEDLNFVAQFYPGVAQKFYDKLKYLLLPTDSIFASRKSKLELLIDESVEGDSNTKNELMIKLRSNLVRVKEIARDEIGMRCMY